MATHRTPMNRFVRRPRLLKRCVGNPHAITFTFDDGPDETETPRVLDLLQRFGIRATFFLVGKFIAGRERIVQRIVAEGHTLGNHTFTHPRFSMFDFRKPRTELQACQTAIRNACGVEAELVRPPFGRITPGLWLAARRERLAIQLWSLDSNDWQCRTEADAQQCAEELKRDAKPGDTILFHDNHRWIEPILERILPALEFGLQPIF